MEKKNIFDIPRDKFLEEKIDLLLKTDNYYVERIVSCGQETDWQEQDEDEFVLLLEGRAKIQFTDEEKELKRGEFLFIPRGKRHRVSYTSSNPFCIWICFFAK